MMPTDLKNFRNYIIFMLFDDLAGRGEICESKIVFKNKKLNPEYNYIVLDKVNKKATYLMNNYKTVSTYGIKEIKINDALYSDLYKYKIAVDKFNNQNYFCLNDAAERQMTRSGLSKLYSSLGKPIGKKLGININRHIKISELVPVKAMNDLADKMCNSIGEQIGVYAKNS